MTKAKEQLTRLVCVCLAILSIATTAAAQTNDIALTILLRDTGAAEPPPLIYVQGEFVGVAPGSVVVPLVQEGAVVEVGLAQLPTAPLYSFILKPSNLDDSRVALTQTTFGLNQELDQNWNDAFLDPNYVQDVQLTKLTDRHYQISLPQEPYDRLSVAWQDINRQPFDHSWTVTIRPENDKSFDGMYEHVTYDVKTGTAQPLSTTRTSSLSPTAWSGGIEFSFDSPFPEAWWTIQSLPTEAFGAEVLTDIGGAGSTEISLKLRMAASFFITLRKSGFIQATYCEHDGCQNSYCDKLIEPTGFRLICRMSPVE